MQEPQKTTVLVTMSEEQFRHFQNTLERVEQLLSIHNKDKDDFLTVPQTMELFKCSRATLNNWRSKGTLMPKVVEGRVYYLKSDCINALNSSATGSKSYRNG